MSGIRSSSYRSCMTPLEAEALLIRYQAALQHIERTDVMGRWALLDEVVYPGDEVMLASLTVAEERGISKLALAMAATAQQLLRDDRHRVATAETVPAMAA